MMMMMTTTAAMVILSSGDAWVGLSDGYSEGTFRWVNTRPASWTNWHSNDPNGAAESQCGRVDSDLLWMDRSCTADFSYICQSQTGGACIYVVPSSCRMWLVEGQLGHTGFAVIPGHSGGTFKFLTADTTVCNDTMQCLGYQGR